MLFSYDAEKNMWTHMENIYQSFLISMAINGITILIFFPKVKFNFFMQTG